MCSPFVRKEANRLYWIVKGMLIPTSWSDNDVEGIYHSYIKRLWGNHENYVHEDGFDFAWSEREHEEISRVAVLGYD